LEEEEQKSKAEVQGLKEEQERWKAQVEMRIQRMKGETE